MPSKFYNDAILLTEQPLDYGYTKLIYSHAAGAMNLDRVEKGLCVFQLDHSDRIADTLGLVRNVRQQAGVTYGDLEVFDFKDPTPEVSHAIELLDNGVRGLSTGIYRPWSEPRYIGNDTWIMDTYTLGEVSMVTVPRDTESGLKNSYNPRIDLDLSKYNNIDEVIETLNNLSNALKGGI